jgi:hypothetical protein
MLKAVAITYTEQRPPEMEVHHWQDSIQAYLAVLMGKSFQLAHFLDGAKH